MSQEYSHVQDACIETAKSLQRVLGGAIIGVSATDAATHRLTVCTVLGLGHAANALRTLAGRRLQGWQLAIKDPYWEQMCQPGWRCINGLYEIFCEQFPLGLTRMVEKILRVKSFHGAPVLCNRKPRAVIVVGLRDRQTFEDPERMDALLDDAAEFFRAGAPHTPIARSESRVRRCFGLPCELARDIVALRG